MVCFYKALAQNDATALTKALHETPHLVEDTASRDARLPLHYACSRGHASCVEALLRAGACVHTATRFNSTPLQLAVHNLATVRHLVAAGADVTLQGVHDVEVVRLLLRHGGNVDERDDNGETVLHRAVEDGCVEVVRVLLQGGADVGAGGAWDGATALHIAVERGAAEIAHLLLAAGADVSAQDDNGNTALHLCTTTETLQLLLNAGADSGMHNHVGMTPPLYWSAKYRTDLFHAFKGHADMQRL